MTIDAHPSQSPETPAGITSAERVADELRDQVLEGVLRPGQQLSEQALSAAVGVSRNTLREAFRLLCHERLAEHRMHRGVFVRELTATEARETYMLRRIVECGALRDAASIPVARRDDSENALWERRVEALTTAAADNVEAAGRSDWDAAGTANGRVHLALAALAGNAAIDRTMRTLLSELRLIFVRMADPRAVHEPYVEANLELATLVGNGDLGRALISLESYLLRSEQHLMQAYAEALRA